MATLRQKIDYLLNSDGVLESAILAKAIEVGVTQLYENAITEAYLAGQLSRETVIAEFGAEKVEALDYAIESVEKDIAWGLADEA
jgi:hypothetical protein